MAAARAREAKPPPVIGKAGRYTVFITPPPTPKPSESPRPLSPSLNPIPSPGSRNVAPLPVRVPSPSLAPAAPPVQVPPPQFEKLSSRPPASVFGFFWNAVAKVQDGTFLSSLLCLGDYLLVHWGFGVLRYDVVVLLGSAFELG